MANIKFDHAVIYNGKFYPADTEIEVKEPKKAAEPKEPKKEAVTKNDDRASKGAKSRNTAD